MTNLSSLVGTKVFAYTKPGGLGFRLRNNMIKCAKA